jgi:hypothetical protein
VEREEDTFPDPMSLNLADSWLTGAAKKLEGQNAMTFRAAAESAAT